MCIYMCIYTHTCIYICVYTYTYIYIYTHTKQQSKNIIRQITELSLRTNYNGLRKSIDYVPPETTSLCILESNMLKDK